MNFKPEHSYDNNGFEWNKVKSGKVHGIILFDELTLTEHFTRRGGAAVKNST